MCSTVLEWQFVRGPVRYRRSFPPAIFTPPSPESLQPPLNSFPRFFINISLNYYSALSVSPIPPSLLYFLLESLFIPDLLQFRKIGRRASGIYKWRLCDRFKIHASCAFQQERKVNVRDHEDELERLVSVRNVGR